MDFVCIVLLQAQITFQDLHRRASEYHQYKKDLPISELFWRLVFQRPCTPHVMKLLYPYIEFKLSYDSDPRDRTRDQHVRLKLRRTHDTDDQTHMEFSLPVRGPSKWLYEGRCLMAVFRFIVIVSYSCVGGLISCCCENDHCAVCMICLNHLC